MEAQQSAAAADEVDVSVVRFWDLRLFAQDEIRSVARHCGDVPARLQDLVNVIIDKSTFNESHGSRRQTFDRERSPRKRDHRHHSSSPTSPSSHSPPPTMESVGFASHRDLVLHFCRQLRIAERDRPLYQYAAAAASLEPASPHSSDVFRPIRLKSMARNSFNRPQDSSLAVLCPSNASSNGKSLIMSTTEISHRSSKKMKTKEEARRKAAHFAARSTIDSKPIPEVATERAYIHRKDEKQNVQLAGHASLSVEDVKLNEQVCTGSVTGEHLAAELCVSKSFSTPVSHPSLALAEQSEQWMSKQVSPLGKSSFLCFTCSKTFANAYSLRRHASSTGHNADPRVVRPGSPITIKKYPSGRCHCLTCGNFYATPFTLKRHALTYGHSVEMIADSEEEHVENKDEIENGSSDLDLTSPKPNLESSCPKYSTNEVRDFKCNKCQTLFGTKQQYVNHLDLHFKHSRKKTSKPVGELHGEEVSSGMSSSSHHDEDAVEQLNENLEITDVPEVIDRQVSPLVEEGNMQQTASEKRPANTCQECGKVFTEYSRYTGHLSVHSRFRKFYTGEASKTNMVTRFNESSVDAAANDEDIFDIKKLSEVGFRRLLSDTSGTYISSLPAKILFSRA